MISTERQQQLMRQMRRSLISLRIQTPQPMIHRVPAYCYFAALVTLLALAVVVSTRSALMFRTQVHSLRERVVYVHRENLQRQEARTAALIAYEQRPKRVVAEKINRVAEHATARLEPVPKSTRMKKIVAKPKPPKKPRISISTSRADVQPPRSADDAFVRLQRGRDDTALAWLASSASRFKDKAAWRQFRYLHTANNDKERQYQLGVLFGAQGESRRSLHWLTLASESGNNSRYIRAFAIAADKLGERERAIAAYRSYLNDPAARDMDEINSRLSALESR